MPDISQSSWAESDAANTAAPPNGWPENQAPSTVNDCARMMMGAIKRFWSRINPVAASGGAANAYTLAPAAALAAYATGEVYSFRANHANTGAATLAISGLGAKAIRKYGAAGKVDLAAGDIQDGQPVQVCYDGTDMVLQSRGPVAVPDSPDDIGALGQGQHAVCVTARYLRPTPTNGCGALAVHESATNKVCFEYLPFDPTAAEHAFFVCKAPKSADETVGIHVRNLAWAHPSTTTNFGVSWKVQFLARSNDDAVDTAYGTAIEVSDTGGTTHDIYIAPDSAAITPGGSWAEGDWLFGRIQRDPADADDTLGVDAWLIGFDLVWTISAQNDG